MTDTSLFPVLPLRDIVVFPHMVVPLFVGRKKSIKALEEVMRQEKRILLLTQKDAGEDEPSPKDIYQKGCIAKVLQLLKLPDGTVRVLVEGGERASVTKFSDRDDYLEAHARIEVDVVDDEEIAKGLMNTVVSQFENYAKLNKKAR